MIVSGYSFDSLFFKLMLVSLVFKLVFACFCVISIVELVLVSLGHNKTQKTSINITHTGINANKIFDVTETE